MNFVVTAPERMSRADELANCLTHALGFAMAVAGTVALWVVTAQYGDALQMVGVAVYGVTLVALYASSTLSHIFASPRLRHFFRTLDQVCIFLLIAGTFTPISLTYLRAGWWWALFITMWAMAIVGILCKLFLTRLHNVSTLAYVLLGWMPIVAIRPIVQLMPGAAMAWILAGGLFYTLGTLFLLRDDRVPFFHAAWHVFVIAGSTCHYVAVWGFVVAGA